MRISFKKKSSLMLFVSSTVFSLLSNAAESTDSTAALFDAIRREDVPAVKQAITDGADIKNAIDEYGRTPLHMAAFWGSPAVIKLLFQAGADVNATDDNGRTPLHLAIFWENPKIAKLLLQVKGIDVNAEDKYGITPLYMAVSSRDLEMVKFLIQAKGIKVNARDKRRLTPLHKAANLDSSETVELLIQKGAKVDAKDMFGRTPLHMASPAGTKLLIQKGADVNATDDNGRTPLLEAIRRHKPEELQKTLIRAGATVDPKELTDQENKDFRTLIQKTRQETEDALLESTPSLPKDIAREISRMVIPDADKLSKQK